MITLETKDLQKNKFICPKKDEFEGTQFSPKSQDKGVKIKHKKVMIFRTPYFFPDLDIA